MSVAERALDLVAAIKPPPPLAANKVSTASVHRPAENAPSRRQATLVSMSGTVPAAASVIASLQRRRMISAAASMRARASAILICVV